MYLSSKIESICNKFSVFYFTKLLEFTLKFSIYFCKMGTFSGDFTVVIGTNLKDPANYLLIDYVNHLSRTGLFTTH